MILNVNLYEKGKEYKWLIEISCHTTSPHNRMVTNIKAINNQSDVFRYDPLLINSYLNLTNRSA